MRNFLRAVPGLIGMFMVAMTHSLSAQYLYADGTKIVDGSGNEVILRGMGLGGWMLQEGYMLETNSFANPQHEIRAAIEGLIGTENTDLFYEAWHANHCTRTDIDSLASWGFNSVRLPMHYNLFTLPIGEEPVAGAQTWLDKGFVMVDSLLRWCADNEMYLILDLHAAPGGQGRDAAISDYDDTKPSLWESEANKQKTIALWRKLAERYAEEPWIGGYDLINETNWNFTAGANANGCDETTNAPLKELFVDITNAIREVDSNHIIFIEGNCWANNHNGIWPAWDDNLVLSFHKYWNYNDQNAVQHMVNLREQYQVPLWLGESGENSNVWFRNAIRLVEDNDIGWAWWPLKKVGSVVNPLTIVKNDGYAQLLDYWQNGGTQPSAEFAFDALMELTENLKIENCIYRKDVVDAMIRQVHDDATRPFSDQSVPGVVHASDFDLGRNGFAYFDQDTANYRVSTGEYTNWNNGWSYRNDAVDIQANTDTAELSNGYNVGWTADGEWLQYTVEVDSSAAYGITIRYAAPSAGRIRMEVDGTDITGAIDLPPTGGYQEWKDMTVEGVALYAGTRKLKIYIEQAGFNLSYLRFFLTDRLSDLAFRAISGATDEEGSAVFLNLNKKVDPASVNGESGFSLSIDGEEVSPSETSVDPESEFRIRIKTDEPFFDNTEIELNYDGDGIRSEDGTLLESFSGMPVTNNLPFHFTIPVRIEAEDFVVNEGLQLEPTEDEGAGQNIGYTNTGDYLDYLVNVPETATYPLEVRIACESNAGKLAFQQLTKEGTLLNETVVDVPVTGGWQTWQSVFTQMTLDQGRSTLKVKILDPEFNLNWFRFSGTVSGLEDRSVTVYPNPAERYISIVMTEKRFTLQNHLTVKNMTGQEVFSRHRMTFEEISELDLGQMAAGIYIIELNMGQTRWKDKLVIK